MSKLNLTGEKFGRLTVIEEAGRAQNGSTLWKCRCDCGKRVITETRLLRSGNTKSCGCLKIDKVRERTIKRNTTHGERHTRLYRIWAHMVWRCENPNCAMYEHYGGRGIRVCEEWRTSFESFSSWAKNNGYNDTLSIDRIDVNGDYEPLNCRWISIVEQQGNKRNNHYLTFDGRTATIAEWSRITGIKAATIQMRIKKGWDAERALTESNRRIRSGD